MGRAHVLTLPPGVASNPYHQGKEKIALTTLCELCDRVLNTRDWPAHKNSKGHRGKEQAEQDQNNAKTNINGTGTWGGDASGLTPDGGFDLASPDSGNDGWATSGNDFSASSYGNKTRGGGGDRACFGCGEVGHRKAECPKGGSGGGQACFNCGIEGHRKMDCTEPLKPRAGGGGGGRTCFNCLQPGHNVSECSEPRVERCRNCDVEGHHSRDCDKPKDWSRVKCNNCYKYGHGEKRCPEPVGGADAQGGGSNGWDAPADSGAATGGWHDAGADASADAGADASADAGVDASAATGGWAGDDFAAGGGTQESWADQTTAEAQW